MVRAVLGDNIDTDMIYPGRYLNITDREKTAEHLFELAYPEIRAAIRPRRFHRGGQELRLRIEPGTGGGGAEVRGRGRGDRGLVRAHLLPEFHQPRAAGGGRAGGRLACAAGDELEIDLAAGEIRNVTRDRAIAAAKLDPRAVELIAAGGLIAYLKRKYAA